MNANYTYIPRVFGDTIEITIKNNETTIGTKLFSIPSYTTDSAIAEIKSEGENFGFFINGSSYPPQKNNTTDSTSPPPSNLTYEIPRITLSSEPDITNVATSQINQDANTQKQEALKSTLNSNISFDVKLTNVFNSKKGEIQTRLVPFVIQLLLPFGTVALQAILAKLPIDEIKNKILCPNRTKLLELINKRNKLAKQINNIYKTITTLSKTLSITNTAITALQTGITVIQAIPYPATGIPPIGLPPLTTGIIEITGATSDRLTEELKKARVSINVLTITLASLGVFLGIILGLLSTLDQLIQQCSEDQNVPFEAINDELNLFVNQSTGVSNSTTIATVQDNTYKGFTLELKLDEINTTQYKKRYAQALSKQGVPVLRTESSFASDPQVLIDQLKFIIDSNPNLTAE